MKTVCSDNQITLYFEGRIDSSNAPQIEAEAMAALEQAPGRAITVDCDALEYTSSAGLRVLLKIAKRDPGLRVVNVSRDVWDVLETTGFSEMIHVERALRKFSVEGCPAVGQGAVGTLYQYDRDTLIKVFREGTVYEDLVREREYAQLAFTLGVPTTISFDIVRVGNCYGMLFELVESSSMGRQIRSNPELVEEMAAKFAAVGKQIHAIDASALGISRAKDTYFRAAKNLKQNYTEEEYEKICAWIDAMPDANCLVHGDFHPRNIMIQDNEPLLIDLGDICIGHPLYDYGTASFVIRWLQPEKALSHSGVPRSHMQRFWSAMLKALFGDISAEKMEQLDHVISCAGMLRAAIIYGISNTFPQDAIDARVADLRERVFPYSDEILETLRGAQVLFDEFYQTADI